MKKSFLLFLFITLILSCRKDQVVIQDGIFGDPLKIEIPGDLKSSTFKVPKDNPLTKQGVALGRQLFYDPILSGNGKQSCASCHQQKFAFTDSTNQYSRGITGAIGTRNSMPLFNLAWQSLLFWDGRSTSLEDQALQPIVDPTEMNASLPDVLAKLNAHPTYPAMFYKAFGKKEITADLLAKAIAQFERTIVSGNSKFDRVKKGLDQFTPQEQDGFAFFTDSNPTTGGDCIHCHFLGSTFSDFEMRNNGLDEVITDKGYYNVTNNPLDIGKMKTPTLRNVGLTAPYMHDGRFQTLDQVMQHYNLHFKTNSPNLDATMLMQLQGRLSKQKRDAIIAFLHTLTDSTLITNPDYANPN